MRLKHLINYCLIIFFSSFLLVQCKAKLFKKSVKDAAIIESDYELAYMDFPNHESGIALFTADWARKNRTELGTEYVIKSDSLVNLSEQIIRNGLNSALKINFNNMTAPSDVVELLMSGFSAINSKNAFPKELQKQIKGIKFNAVAFRQPINLELEIQDKYGNVIEKQNFSIGKTEMEEYSLFFNSSSFKNISFKIKHDNQKSDFEGSIPTSIIIDDVYYVNGDDAVFTPPADDTEFLKWIQKSAIRFFLWNYHDLENDKGLVQGSTVWYNTLSISGQGFGMAAHILAEKEGMISTQEAKRRILSMLKWMQDQDWYQGKDGWKGFPHHWFHVDGTEGYPGWGPVTVDWAMAAAGIRVVRQYYLEDSEINSICTELLSRPNWKDVFDEKGFIAMGIDYKSGEINPWRWGGSFTEETELTFLEARNSNQMDKSIFDVMVREKSSGFYPGWWSTGFEFNWMQLWTGPIEPYKTNSTIAYQNDATTCQSEFGRPIMGLTAAGIITGIDDNGFVKVQYFGNQGSSPSRSKSNKKIAPAPYGAALALPFVPNQAITGLREFVKLGYYHPIMGLPGTVRLIPIEGGGPEMMPHWGIADLELGPMLIAIDQYFDNSIGQLYQSDPEVKISLEELIESIKN
ncbi:hypothetical protein K8354_17195 [Polaribacter litorisediminis]|uniref:hypothetical protein n=1 Tax=Polaribacter litorisediminis TaxID=1908341 RepID=UPI001CBF9987|nr:hypothetical protein [Polaribacter litorisediminis]UAM97995.1 hypothetical protein K8354_17195 [Polaribacter litorisediminis]